MNQSDETRLKSYGPYAINFCPSTADWEVEGRHKQRVVGQCATADEATSKAPEKITQALLKRSLSSLDTVWLY